MSKKRILVNRDKVEVLSATCYIDQYYRDDSNDWHGAGDTVFTLGFLMSSEQAAGCLNTIRQKEKPVLILCTVIMTSM